MDKFLVAKRLRDETSPPAPAEQWRPPKKFAVSKEASRGEATVTANSFTGLPVDDVATDSVAFKKASTKKSVGQIPPILVELLGDWSHKNIKAVIEKYEKGFHMEYRGRNRVKVQCYSVNGHQAVKEGLLKEKVVFHTFSRKDEKLPKVVIKGLPSFLQDSIPAELAALGFPGATATKIKTQYETECPPLLIQLPNGSDMRKFKQIKYLSSCVVNIQRFKSNTKEGTQCFRCQAFGHASKNCNRPARCVKCTSDHPTRECPKKDRSDAAVCCNCKQDHPANYSRCPARIKYIERIHTRRDGLRHRVAPVLGNKLNASAPVGPSSSSLTWAKVTSGNGAQHEATMSSNISQTHPTSIETAKPCNPMPAASIPEQQPPKLLPVGKTITNDPATAEMLEILGSIRSLKLEFLKCETFIDKVILILTHMGHYV